jgi:hypothetical protein
LIYTEFCKEERGRAIVRRRYIVRGSYPFPLMSKGDRNIKSMNTWGEMVTGGVWLFPSMPKGEIVGNLVVIDVNTRRIPKESPKSPKSDGFIWRSLWSGPLMAYI